MNFDLATRFAVPLIAALIATAGCTASKTLHHPRTGETVTCGPYLSLLDPCFTAWMAHCVSPAQRRLETCIYEHRQQGYIERQ